MPDARIEPGGRLVEDQEPRPVEQRLGDLEPALEASRQLTHPVVGSLGQVEALEPPGHPIVERASAQAVEMALVPEVLPHGQLPIDAR